MLTFLISGSIIMSMTALLNFIGVLWTITSYGTGTTDTQQKFIASGWICAATFLVALSFSIAFITQLSEFVTK